MWTLARIPIPLFLTILFFGKVHRVLNLLSYTPKNCCAFLLKVVHLSKYNLMRCFESDSRVAIFQGAVFLGGNITAGSFPKGSVLRGGKFHRVAIFRMAVFWAAIFLEPICQNFERHKLSQSVLCFFFFGSVKKKNILSCDIPQLVKICITFSASMSH